MDDIYETSDYSCRSRPRFSHGIIRGLSITVTLFGLICVGLGVAILVVLLKLTCMVEERYWDRPYDEKAVTRPDMCGYMATLLSPGLWSGLEFFASGVVGVVAARKKTTSLIICMMVLSLVTVVVSATGCTIAIAGNFDYYWQYNVYPMSLHLLDSALAFFCGVVFILSWITFSLACYALCCCNCNQSSSSRSDRESTTRYQRLTTDNHQTNFGNAVRNEVDDARNVAGGSRVEGNPSIAFSNPMASSSNTPLMSAETA